MPGQEVLFERMPRRGRVLSESLLVVTLFFVPPNLLAFGGAWPVLAAGFVAWSAWALALTRRRPLGALAAVAAVAGLLWSTTVRGPQAPPPRLGIQPRDGKGCAEVAGTIAGTPADGRLRPGDCISAVAGQPLDAAAPTADLLARLRDEKRLPAGDTTLTVTRDGAPVDVPVTLGPPPRVPGLTGSDLPWLLLRSLAALVLVAVLLAANGQRASSIGLEPARLPRELLWGGPALLGAFAAHLLVAIPIGLVLFLTGGAREQASARIGALGGLASVEPWQLLPSLVVLGVLEEVVFRGFLLPRTRVLTASPRTDRQSGRGWWMAVVLVQLLFGLGHLYEGGVAVLQTMMLGVYFSVVFLWRLHLGSVIAAHVAFNAIMFALVLFIQRSGVLESLSSLK
jgi:membrane protease YdiL (CAAX protease family)